MRRLSSLANLIVENYLLFVAGEIFSGINLMNVSNYQFEIPLRGEEISFFEEELLHQNLIHED